MSNAKPLQGRRILVTGAATGIGAAAVRVLTEAGAEIAATYHQTPPPDDLAATWLQCDARDPDAVSAMVQQAVEHLGGLDVLVNAAGLWQAGVPGFISADDISFLLDTNVKATILTNQAAHAVMKDQDDEGGRIINFGSSEAVVGSPISAVYAATKGAVQAWTRSAARAWAADNVTVNALAPAVQTPGADRLRAFLGPEAGALIDQQMKMMIPLGGALGDPARDVGPARSTALVGRPLKSLGYPPFSLKDDVRLRQLPRCDRGVSISLGEGMVIALAPTCPAWLRSDVMAELGAAQISFDRDRNRTFDQLATLTELAAERGMGTGPGVTIGDRTRAGGHRTRRQA
jgi:NAD(P)-dependent dehydrogenase (short-subunit alcohol dehydrogenase family)